MPGDVFATGMQSGNHTFDKNVQCTRWGFQYVDEAVEPWDSCFLLKHAILKSLIGIRRTFSKIGTSVWRYCSDFLRRNSKIFIGDLR